MQGDVDLIGRARAYKLLSLAFAPHDGRGLPDLAAALHREAEGYLAEVRGDPGLEGAVRRLSARTSSVRPSRDVPIGGASAVFGTPAPYPPYEGEYGMAHVFMKLQSLADVAGFYRAFGLELSPSFKDRPDHIAAEFEFMHFLLVKQAQAAASGRTDLAEETHRAEAMFLSDHLGAWAPGFLKAVAAEGGHAFYEALADVGGQLLSLEIARLGVAPRTAEITKPRRPREPEDGCPAVPPS